VHFARKRFGCYEVIDFFAVLVALVNGHIGKPATPPGSSTNVDGRCARITDAEYVDERQRTEGRDSTRPILRKAIPQRLSTCKSTWNVGNKQPTGSDILSLSLICKCPATCAPIPNHEQQ
jgi:hypothetical protein